MVKICYIDESGDLGTLPADSKPDDNHQPVLVITGLFVDYKHLYDLTHDFIKLKYRFYPGLNYPTERFLDRIIPEIKGADVRRNAMRGGRRAQRHAIGFMDRIIDLLFKYDVKCAARVWVKILGEQFNGKAVYTSSIQSLFDYFENYLAESDDHGVVIADSRDYMKNISVSHSVFTQKFRQLRPMYPHIIEMPCFGHSNNSAGIQLCDIISSAFLYPIASYVYCSKFVHNVHTRPEAEIIRDRYGLALKDMQHRFTDEKGYKQGGIVVSDPLQKQNAMAMFTKTGK